MSDPVVTFGRAVPDNLRDWDRVLARLNTVVRVEMRGETPVYTINESTEFPSVPTIIDAARAFLPHPQMPQPTAEQEVLIHRVFTPPAQPVPQIESQIMAIKAFAEPKPMPSPVDDVQAVLAMRIFGA